MSRFRDQLLWLAATCLLPTCAAFGIEPFRIQVVDDATGRGVPLVELRTVNEIKSFTDSHGNAAIIEPGLAGQKVFFHVRSHGYEFPKDAFGYQGKALEVTPGGSATLRIKRLNIAERLYRMTGEGIYRDSVLTGQPVPIREPLLNAQVFGSDSVVNAVYRGKLRWFWGDTNRPGYPLGNFHVPGAVSDLPGRGGLDPSVGVNLTYFTDETGFAKSTAKMPGMGPTWIGGLVALKNDHGQEEMYASYVKVEPPLTVYERGLARWNEERDEFERVEVFPKDAPLIPDGHTFQHDGYVYFCTPYPLTRVKATAAALRNLSQYEAFTCLAEGSRLDDPQLDRAADGTPRYTWKRNTPAVTVPEQAKLVKSGKLPAHAALLQLRDHRTGQSVQAHSGSVYWNDYRRRWVMITVQGGGTSFLGEVWYAEADTPTGPWVEAVKIVTHDRYSFYNPKQHPYFDQEGGRRIYLEGTYTQSFSGNTEATPRYEYNQMMYRLDLADPRLAPPVPISRADDGTFRTWQTPTQPERWAEIPFFALDRPGEDTIPISQLRGEGGQRLLTLHPPKSNFAAVFHALPAASESPSASVVPLYEFRNERTGERHYTTDAAWSMDGFRRTESPVCRVWANPYRNTAAKN